MKPCIFCTNPRTNKRGEHVWDDWLNREDGKEIQDHSTTFIYGADGDLIRSYPSVGIHVTLPVVCDACNNGWMSQISDLASERLKPLIRRGEAAELDEEDLFVITALAFLKSAVLDWAATDKGRRACIPRSSCLAFRASLVESHGEPFVLPAGLQVWIARYQRARKFEGWAFTEEMTGGHRRVKGYRTLVITYVVGSFIFQLLYPRWTKVSRKRLPPPFLQVAGDLLSVPIWPGVTKANWPPYNAVGHGTLDAFRERFRRIHFRTD